MAIDEAKKKFQKKIKDGIDPVEHSRRVRQSILMRKYKNSKPLAKDEGVKEEDECQKQ